MAWLLRRGEVLASLERAGTPIERVRGFSGREGRDGALLIAPWRVAHSIGLRNPLDVAYLDDDLVVVKTTQIGPNRVALPCRGATGVLEVAGGAFERWHLTPGDPLEIEG